MIGVVSLNTCIDRVLAADSFAAGTHCQARFIKETPAGKGVNVARYLAALKQPVTLFGLVGEDTSAVLAKILAAENINDQMRVLPIRTRVNTTIIDSSAKNETHIRETGAKVSAEELSVIFDKICATIPSGSWVVFSGSLPLGIGAENFSQVLKQLLAKDFRVAVDTSGAGLTAAVAAGVQLIKPNREELAALCQVSRPADLALPHTAQNLIDSHPGLTVLASTGAAGAWLISQEKSWHAQVESEIKICSTVGAGDALLAGYLCATSQLKSPEQCLRSAVQTATASLACPCPGTLARILRRGG